MIFLTMDNGGRRFFSDRRRNNFKIIIDRRIGHERRSKKDRRSGVERRNPFGFRVQAGLDRRQSFSLR